jgi:hypothetical protein
MSQEDALELTKFEVDKENKVLAGNVDLWNHLYGGIVGDDEPIVDEGGIFHPGSAEDFELMLQMMEEEGMELLPE